jgi:transposase
VSELTVGLDVHAKGTVFTIQRTADGEVVATGEVPTTVAGLTGLCDSHHLAAETQVGLETGTMAFYVARVLMRLGLKPIVIDAAEVRTKARRPNQKCDKRDAFDICDGVRRGFYQRIVYVPSIVISRARDTLSRRRHFVRLSTREINAAKRLVRAAGLNHLVSRTLTTDEAWLTLLRNLETECDLHVWVGQHFVTWKGAQEQVAELDEDVKGLKKEQEVAEGVKLLKTAPGFGDVISTTLVAGWGDITRFPSTKHAASYVGFSPATYHSGDREVSGHITKRGSPEMRAMLCEAAHQARHSDHPLHPYFAALAARRGYKMAITAVAHRLCRIAFRMLRTRTEFDVTKLGVEYAPHTRKREVAYRRKDAHAKAAKT